MGRKKIYKKRYLIGLNEVQSNNLEGMANLLGLNYSEVVSMLMRYYQLHKSQ